MGSAEWRVSVPVGVKFQPTDEELVDHYLKRKMEDEVFEDSDIMPEIDVCKYDPWDLPAAPLSTVLYSSYHAMELYFFSPRDYKYTNSTRANRRTPSGYWKPTGKERVIKDRWSNVIGKKRTLTFYRLCQPKAQKTDWVMHQYDRIETANPKLVQRDFVLCRVKQKSDKDTSVCDEGERCSYNVPNHEYQAAAPEYYTSSAPQSPEPGVLLQANGINSGCTEMQSPFGDDNHSVTDKNDISTGEGDPHTFTVSNFQNEAAYDMFSEPYYGHDYCSSTTQSPLYTNHGHDYSSSYDMFPQPYHGHDYSSSTSQSPLYTNHGNVLHDSLHNQECSMQKSAFCDNGSIIYDEQNNYTTEVYPQPENLASVFRPLQVHDYTLLPLGNAN